MITEEGSNRIKQLQGIVNKGVYMKRKGYTLVEVMAALMILMVSAEAVALSTATAVRIHVRTQRIIRAGEKVRNRGEEIPVELSLQIEEGMEPIKRNGSMYRETVSGKGKSFTAWSIYTYFPETEGVEGK